MAVNDVTVVVLSYFRESIKWVLTHLLCFNGGMLMASE
jgi:hypothetical protein